MSRHGAPRRRRFYGPLAVAVVLAVVAVGAWLLGGRPDRVAQAGNGDPAASTTPASSSAPAARTPVATLSPSRSPAAPSRTPSARSSPARSTAPASRNTPASSSRPASVPASTSAAAGVLDVINNARAQAGLPAYSVQAALVTSSGRHTQLMAGGCGLQHQCPGEASLGDRETAAGVSWTSAGENIGEGGPVASTTAAITAMAVELTQEMLAEKPPDDGHRQNILSASYTRVGITVYRDADGTVWMTQDFAGG